MGSTSEDTNEPTDIYDWMVRVLFSVQEENNTRLKARRASELTEVIKCKFNRGMMTIWPPTHDNQELHANLQKLEKATASTLKAFIVTEVYAQGRELSGLYHHPTTSEYRQDLLSAIGDVRSGTWRNTLEEVLHELILSLLGRFMIAGSLPGHDRISTLTGQTFDSRLSPYVWGFTLSSGFILRGWSGFANHPMVESEDSTFLVPSSSSESVNTCRGYLTCKPTGLGGPAGVWGSEVLLSRRQLP
ncbi:hypothetical protein TREMEDRAFT_63782 [Tremella mesenterica DSM 1558]|uniref:uncharacterized protein n=1 Tax=Tremella mesenterica (strain ATCC 24925 / CBS 8224 / DSM 1558 / NBRC 9311 / NRRL Y-6157 / RJB 2259-6 / UBC 559-6) TaxID=578456 RepID=UPI0003F49521|nr:uncharacterized protein TREMEDRAFT_63782 [Tremella mesenterica DSM 1558]EIW67891.1 hypothetical protein TREMEDRAFT_63782 [Tremella mesenterica DSM 1558]